MEVADSSEGQKESKNTVAKDAFAIGQGPEGRAALPKYPSSGTRREVVAPMKAAPAVEQKVVATPRPGVVGTCKRCDGKVKGCPHCPGLNKLALPHDSGNSAKQNGQSSARSNRSVSTVASTIDVLPSRSKKAALPSGPTKCGFCGATKVQPKYKRGANACSDRCQTCFRKF